MLPPSTSKGSSTSSVPLSGRERKTLLDALWLRGSRYQDDLAAILSDRVPARLGAVAARAIAAFILTTVTAMINEATRLRAEGRTSQEITAILTDTVGRALEILDTGVGAVATAPEPVER